MGRTMARDASKSLVGTTVSHYRILDELGGGGMGVVYQAEDTRLERTVALKFLPPELYDDEQSKERFIREAKAASALDHPNICTIYEIDETDEGQLFIAMACYEGETLKHRLDRGVLAMADAVDVISQVASGLAVTHERGLIHRDIKPANVFLTHVGPTTPGRVKLLDFGLAKTVDDMAGLTQTGAAVGTPAYMSPEQTRGDRLDARTDLWSLGVLLFELLTGELPFQGPSFPALIYAIHSREPKPLRELRPEIPEELAEIVSKLLRKRAGRRYASCRELIGDLARWSGTGPTRDAAGIEATGILPAKRPPVDPSAATLASVWSPSGGVDRRASSGSRARPIESLAVLPLTNDAADADTEYLSDGITETTINRLSQVSSLRVMAYSTVSRFKGRHENPVDVGRELGVQAVLTGRLLLRGDTVVIKTELVDVADGTNLWGDRYSRQASDVFAVEEEIAEKISEALRLELTGEERARLGNRPTEDPAAYQCYLKGRYHWRKRTSMDLEKSVRYFRQAIELDGGYALAYAALAASYAMLERYGVEPPRGVMPRAREAALKALDLDDGLAEAHAALAIIKFYYDWDWRGAERSFQLAVERNHDDPTTHHWYGWVLAHVGHFDEAVAELTTARELDPLSLIIQANLGTVHYFARDYLAAVDQNRKALELDEHFVVAKQWLARALTQLDRHDEAIGLHRETIEQLGDDPESIASLGHALAAGGRRDEARELQERLDELAGRRYVPPYWSAILATGLGETDRAFETLERAFEDRFDWMIALQVDPVFDPLRDDPRFEDLVRRVGLPR